MVPIPICFSLYARDSLIPVKSFIPYFWQVDRKHFPSFPLIDMMLLFTSTF